jgi:hypothetical protein
MALGGLQLDVGRSAIVAKGTQVMARSEDDRFEYRLENDPRFLQRIERTRASLRAGRGVALEDLK